MFPLMPSLLAQQLMQPSGLRFCQQIASTSTNQSHVAFPTWAREIDVRVEAATKYPSVPGGPRRSD